MARCTGALLVVAVLAVACGTVTARQLTNNNRRLPVPIDGSKFDDLLRGLNIVRSGGGSSSSEEPDYEYQWTPYAGLTCYDSNQDNTLAVRRGVSHLSNCQHRCERHSDCNAVTWNQYTLDCTLWTACDELRQLNNGDTSSILERTEVEPESESSSDNNNASDNGSSSDDTITGDEVQYVWDDKPGRSCLDDSFAILRGISDFDACKRECEQRDECNAITFSDANTCFIKQQCDEIVYRNNGDNSALLTRQACEPPTQVFCTSGSTSENCVNFCGRNTVSAPLQSSEQCGGTIYVCL